MPCVRYIKRRNMPRKCYFYHLCFKSHLKYDFPTHGAPNYLPIKYFAQSPFKTPKNVPLPWGTDMSSPIDPSPAKKNWLSDLRGHVKFFYWRPHNAIKIFFKRILLNLMFPFATIHFFKIIKAFLDWMAYILWSFDFFFIFRLRAVDWSWRRRYD